MLKLAKETKKYLVNLIQGGEMIPDLYFSLLGPEHLGALLDIATKVDNRKFLLQLRHEVRTHKRKTAMQGSNAAEQEVLNKMRGRVHKVPLSHQERNTIESRLSEIRSKRINRSTRGKKLYVHFVQGGAPGLSR